MRRILQAFRTLRNANTVRCCGCCRLYIVRQVLLALRLRRHDRHVEDDLMVYLKSYSTREVLFS